MYPNNDLVEGNIFLVNDIHILGKFNLHYGSILDNPSKASLRACFKCTVSTEDEIKLLPGHQTFDDKFYHCPLLAWYIQINELKITIGNKDHFQADIVAFTKDFKEHRQFEVNIFTNNGTWNLGNLNDYVNALNRYVEYSNDVKLLNISLFKERIDFNILDERALFNIINQLSFRYYETCLVRVGRDNLFWREVEIKNLPKSKYLRRCFCEILTNTPEKYDLESELMLIEYGYEYAYAPSHGRKEIESDGRKELEIKDLLKYKLQNIFDPVIELNERFIE